MRYVHLEKLGVPNLPVQFNLVECACTIWNEQVRSQGPFSLFIFL